MISNEYRNRVLHLNVKNGLRRCELKNIYHVFRESDSRAIIITKYDLNTDEWAEFKRIDFQRSGDGYTAIVVKDKLYMMKEEVLEIIV